MNNLTWIIKVDGTLHGVEVVNDKAFESEYLPRLCSKGYEVEIIGVLETVSHEDIFEQTLEEWKEETGDDAETRDDTRIEKEFEAVMELIRLEYPKAADYRTEDSETFEILDAEDKVIATVKEEYITRKFNEL